MPSHFSRRKFLVGMGAVATAGKAGSFVMATSGDAPAAANKFPIGFSTLGCPAWNWDKILDFAQQHWSCLSPTGRRGTADSSRGDSGAG